ncbi:MAG: glycosyltransferase family 39 protein [Candidatus Nomurabacteria bacterium]|nr:glycosyltransferase family 39 protein [Candidatus Nomurabacteria bacterium]
MKVVKKASKFFSRYPRVTMFSVLGLAVAIFLVITLSKIGAWSVWFDESFSAYMIRQKWSDIWHFTALDVNAPLYYFLLKGWSFIVGHSDVALRLLSVIFGVGAVVSGFFLTRRLFGQRVGYLALLFLTLSPMLLRYATEMRCYTLMVFLLIMATYVFIVASEKRKIKWWLLYGFLIAAAMWTHYYAVLPILAHFVWRFITLKKKFFTRDFVTAIIFAGMLFLPWLPAMIRQITTVQNTGFWIPPFGIDTVGNFAGEMAIYNTHDHLINWVALGLVIALVLLITLLIYSHRTLMKKTRTNFSLVLALIFLSPLILAILSLPPLRPMFINRYVIFSMVMFAILTAVALGTKLKTKVLRITQRIFLVLILTLSVWGVRNVLVIGNYNFDTRTISMAKTLMNQITKQSPKPTAVIADTPWIFYDAVVYETCKNPVYFLDSSTKYEYGSLEILREAHEYKILNLAKFAKPGQKIWYISSSEQDAFTPPMDNWEQLRRISLSDSIDGNSKYSAAEYLVK